MISNYIKLPIGSLYAIYMATFTINIPPMLAYIPYMDPMGSIKLYQVISNYFKLYQVTHRIHVCYIYMVTFAINIPPMLVYIPDMDPMGYIKLYQVGG